MVVHVDKLKALLFTSKRRDRAESSSCHREWPYNEGDWGDHVAAASPTLVAAALARFITAI